MTEVAACGHALELHYGEVVALAASDFSIPTGAVTALIGPNGSGKSTLLGAIAGLIDPDGGTIEVLGSTPERARPRVAFVPQSTKVNELLPVTVWEVVAMGRYSSLGRLRRFSPQDVAVVNAAIERLGLGDLVRRHLAELSGGQRQRVFVAQGLAQERDLLVMDEPLTALDGVSAAVINGVIDAERTQGGTVVITTHDLGEAANANHVILLSGRVVAEGPPSRVLTGDTLSRAYRTQIAEVDGRLVFDDPAHMSYNQPHVHLDRAAGTHPHDE
jgi:manganese transport system ATP-binding protein